MLPPGEDTPWLEHSSLPLKWSVPAGVLFDLLAGEGELPWSLTVSFFRLLSVAVLCCCVGPGSLLRWHCCVRLPKGLNVNMTQEGGHVRVPHLSRIILHPTEEQGDELLKDLSQSIAS